MDWWAVSELLAVYQGLALGQKNSTARLHLLRAYCTSLALSPYDIRADDPYGQVAAVLELVCKSMEEGTSHGLAQAKGVLASFLTELDPCGDHD